MKTFLQTLLVALGLCSSCTKTNLLSQAEFTSEFAKALNQASPETKVEIVKDLELKMTGAQGSQATSFLDNAYDQYKHNPASKDDIIQRFVATAVEATSGSPKSEELDRSRIIPVIKDKPWLVEIRKSMENRGAKEIPENVHEELNTDLIVLYAEDSSTSIRYITTKDLEKAHLDPKELRSLACENLKRLLPEIKRHGEDGFYMFTAGGDYEASLLLFDSIWTDIAKDVHGEIVVAIPTRDLLLVTGSEDREGLQRMTQTINKVSTQKAYTISRKLFVRRNGTFAEFTP